MAIEYREADYPDHQVVIEHKQSTRARLNQLAEEAGARHPEELANAMFLFIGGAYMAVRLFGSSPNSPAANVAKVARHLIDGQCRVKKV